MYLGMLFVLLGEVVLLGSVSPFIVPILFVILMNKKFIGPEEKILEEQFESDFRTYRNKVRRWV